MSDFLCGQNDCQGVCDIIGAILTTVMLLFGLLLQVIHDAVQSLMMALSLINSYPQYNFVKMGL